MYLIERSGPGKLNISIRSVKTVISIGSLNESVEVGDHLYVEILLIFVCLVYLILALTHRLAVCMQFVFQA